MATGDIKNNLRKLMVELKQVRYPVTEVDLKGLAQGTPRSFLPILHYIFLDYSVDLTEFFSKDYELYGKTDLRFVETVYKVLRDIFHYKPPLTREQFLSIGYAERKIIELCDILKRCREKSSELNPKTTKNEKKHSHKKVKTKFTEVGKEAGSQFSYFPEKGGQSLTHSQNEEPKKNKNENGKKINEENKENSFNASLFHSQVSDKPGTSIRNEETLKQESILKRGIKSVRWEEDDQERSSAMDTSEKNPVLPSTALTEIKPNSDTRTQNKSAFSNEINTSMRAPPKNIPMPVTMTTIPKPSPELMLTPIGKTRHQPIPLSISRHTDGEDITNVSLVDLTDSSKVQQPKVVRHRYDGEIESRSNEMANQESSLISSQDNELKVLKGIIQELQEKLDSVLLQNNEMSARVVLLESRVKLLEEASSRNQCENCMNTNYCLPKNNVSTNPFYAHMFTTAPTSGVLQESGIDSRNLTQPNMVTGVSQPDHVTQSTASSGNFKCDFNMDENNSRFQSTGDNLIVYRNEKCAQQALHNGKVPQMSTVTEVSEDDDDDDDNDVGDVATSAANRSDMNPGGSPVFHTPSKGSSTSVEAISPFLTTQEIRVKFSDPSTTATIINVERRLKETREMLANAAKFTATSLP